MLDFNNVLATPGSDIQYFTGPTVGFTQWQTWRKPRGVKWVYMIAVGSGTSGGCGTNTSSSQGGGGAGGGSGAQSVLFIPAIFLPDVLYIQTPSGGRQPDVLVSADRGVGGFPTYVAIEPFTTLGAAQTVLVATGGLITGNAATPFNGGVAGTAATVAAITNTPLAGRGQYRFYAGQAGTNGGSGSPNAGGAIAYPTTGLMVMGGTGGAGVSTVTTTGTNGITGVGLGDNFPSVPGGSNASNSPGSAGTIIKPWQHTSGTGGGGAFGSGAGGDGAPGCGGGGAAGSFFGQSLNRPGNGGPGFVYIISW